MRAERWLRARTTIRLHREIGKLEAAGTRVRVLAPAAADLAAMGWNAMDSRRRQRVLTAARRSTVDGWAAVLAP